MLKKYIEICGMFDTFGNGNMYLDVIHQKIKSPDFKYQPDAFPEILISEFLASSYWLDSELFNESCLYKTDYKNVSSPRHLKMLDIGCTLIDKGFPLEYDPGQYAQSDLNQLGGYVKTFVEQCHKRHAFLHKKTTKIKRLPPFQKIHD